ncbi:hypothetical protein MASR1M66_10320 [Aminivibrio sp.]
MKDFTLRRTSLYIPGNNPGMLVNAAVFGADSVIFDLEDAIPLRRRIPPGSSSGTPSGLCDIPASK